MKLWSICLLALLLFSCDNAKVNYKKPDNLIPKDQMVDILYDIHLALGTSNQQNTQLEKNRNYMSLVYEKYGIDSTTFAISNIYYTAEIEQYEEIFERVEARLKEVKDVYDEKRDSISSEFVPAGKVEDIEN